MKKHFTSGISALLILMAAALQGQTYSFEVLTSPYQPLAVGTPLVNSSWDDPEFVIDLGYEFPFFDDESRFLISPELFLGGLFSTNLEFESLNLIAAFSSDLIDRGYEINELMSPITYSTSGDAGNRVTTLQYANAGFYAGMIEDSVYVDFINFQLRLYEATGNIEIHIGPHSIMDPGLDFEGSPGPVIGLIQGYDYFNDVAQGEVMMLSGNGASPDVVTEYGDHFVTWPIPENTIYRFSRASTSVWPVDAGAGNPFYFPNPGRDVIFLRDQLESSVVSGVTVLNHLGQRIFIDESPEQIDFTHQAPGIYYLSFRTPQGEAFQRISIVR